jgi:diguanylate cyclase (GGDEF)-like protein/PAS domain S-box-containing protein
LRVVVGTRERGNSCFVFPRKPNSPPQDGGRSGRWQQIGFAVLVGAGYFGLAWLGLQSIAQVTHIEAIWPAGGALLGVLLLIRARRWSWLLLASAIGAVAAQLIAGRSLAVAVGMSAVDCAESLLVALILTRVLGGRFALDNLPRLVRGLAGVATGVAVTATLGATIATLGLGSPYGTTVLEWWLGHCLGILVATPLVLLIADTVRERRRPSTARAIEGAVVLGALAAVSIGIFTRPVGQSRLLLDFSYPIVPFLVWAVLRLRSRAVPLANLTLSSIAVAGTMSNRGPFTSSAAGATGHVLQLQTFLTLATFTTLVGGALVDELRERQRSLTASNVGLRREREALRTAEKQFRGLLEAAPDAIVIVDDAGRIRLVNAQAERLFGYSRGELIGQPLESLVPERHRARHVDHRHAFCHNPTARPMGVGLELCVVRKDGRELPVEISLGPVETDAGILVSAAIRDVSERKRLVVELEQRARLMDLVHDAIIVREPGHSRISYWNREAEEIYGYTAQEACGQIAHDLLATVFSEPQETIDARLLARGRWEGELWHRRKDGRRILVSSRQALQRGQNRQPIAVIELNSDITEQRRVEDAKRRLAAIVEHSEDAIVGKTPEGTITEWNRGAERLYGYTAEEAVGRNVRMLMGPDAAATEREILARVFSGEALEQIETTRIRKDGSQVQVSLTISPVQDRTGAIVAASAIGRDITERKRFEGQLQHLADHDHLTGLFNRRRFEEELTRELARTKRHGKGGTLLAIDIDNFKYVNDSLGHSAGDALIALAADAFRTRLRATDVIARLGGDEFAAILPEVDENEARIVAGELLEAIRSRGRAALPHALPHITASIGIAPFARMTDATAEDLLVEADIAMYDAKEAGRNRVSVYSSREDREGRMKARLTWADRIRRALAEDRFVLHAQPILSLNGDRAPRHELLLRMLGDNGELILPDMFLSIAERMDLVQEIDRWVLREAIRVLGREQRAGGNVMLEVNLSAKSVGDADLPALIAGELDAACADGSGLCVEVTETAAIVNLDRAKQFAARVGELGCEFALDDFGAGFASFYYLKHLPFDYLKIDGEFIQGICGSQTDQLVVRSLVEIAHGLGKRTIAEFVDGRDALELLRCYEVDYAQGFYVAGSRPLDAVNLSEPAVVHA